MASSHSITVAQVSDLYYASCSCGWKARGRFTKVMAEREGEEHLAEPTLPPSLLYAHRNGQKAEEGTLPMAESQGLFGSAIDRVRNGQGPMFQFGEILGLARRAGQGHQSPKEEPPQPVAHQAEANGDHLYQCFIMGVGIGDALEDLEQETEDLVERVARDPTRQQSGGVYAPSDKLGNLVLELYDGIMGGSYCSFNDTSSKELITDIRDKILGLKLKTPEDVLGIRREVDQLSARMAYLGRTP